MLAGKKYGPSSIGCNLTVGNKRYQTKNTENTKSGTNSWERRKVKIY